MSTELHCARGVILIRLESWAHELGVHAEQTSMPFSATQLKQYTFQGSTWRAGLDSIRWGSIMIEQLTQPMNRAMERKEVLSTDVERSLPTPSRVCFGIYIIIYTLVCLLMGGAQKVRDHFAIRAKCILLRRSLYVASQIYPLDPYAWSHDLVIFPKSKGGDWIHLKFVVSLHQHTNFNFQSKLKCFCIQKKHYIYQHQSLSGSKSFPKDSITLSLFPKGLLRLLFKHFDGVVDGDEDISTE